MERAQVAMTLLPSYFFGLYAGLFFRTSINYLAIYLKECQRSVCLPLIWKGLGALFQVNIPHNMAH